jgi:hypothetical protein
MAEKKLIKGPDGKYYTPTAYKNQWGKQNVDISNMTFTDVKKINSNPAKNASGSTGKQAIKAINKARGGKTKVSPMAKVRKPGNFRGRGGAIGGGFLDQIK